MFTPPKQVFADGGTGCSVCHQKIESLATCVNREPTIPGPCPLPSAS